MSGAALENAQKERKDAVFTGEKFHFSLNFKRQIKHACTGENSTNYDGSKVLSCC